MENLNLHIANKIKALRKAHNLTQNELAEKINYSNKAVSRWETGEVIPDIPTLNNICEVFDVTLASMFEDEIVPVKHEKKATLKMGNKLAISLLAMMGVWIVMTILYCAIFFFYHANVWQLFIIAVPLSCLIGIIFNSIWGKSSVTFMLLTAMLWSALSAIYLSFLTYNLWYIYFIGIPVQIVIVLCDTITKNLKNKKKAKKNEEIENKQETLNKEEVNISDETTKE